MDVSEKRVYLFSLGEMEFPVYDSGKNRIGNCKRASLCEIEKRKIRTTTQSNETGGAFSGVADICFSNGLFLSIFPKEECIVMRPWYIRQENDGSSYDYYIIPKDDYADKIDESSVTEINSTIKCSYAILLNFPVKSVDDLSKYTKFQMKGEKTRLLW